VMAVPIFLARTRLTHRNADWKRARGKRARHETGSLVDFTARAIRWGVDVYQSLDTDLYPHIDLILMTPLTSIDTERCPV
jgi:hypothetical protein